MLHHKLDLALSHPAAVFLQEADDYRQEAARVQQTLDDMAGSTQDQINVLQTRVEQASALRSAADADYKDISAQLQNERFRVETLMVGALAFVAAAVCC